MFRDFIKYLVKLKNIKHYKNYLEKLLKMFFYYLLVSSGLSRIYSKQKLYYYCLSVGCIEGWFLKESACMFAFINYIQKKENIVGDLFEIGTHHGKSAIMLGLMTNQKKEKLGLCDIFSNQELNISNSGRGNKEILVRNLSSFFKDLHFIQIYEKKSSDLTKEECGFCRFFHIDGGHSFEETYSDLCLASSSLIQKGIVAIDDFFHVFYPEVTEAVCKFILDEKTLVPVALGFNKLFLCRQSEHEMYLRLSQLPEWKMYLKNKGVMQKQLFGYKVQVFGVIK